MYIHLVVYARCYAFLPDDGVFVRMYVGTFICLLVCMCVWTYILTTVHVVSVVQYVAVCCSVAQCGAVRCSVLQCTDFYTYCLFVDTYCYAERRGAGVEYHFQEFNEPYAPL